MLCPLPELNRYFSSKFGVGALVVGVVLTLSLSVSATAVAQRQSAQLEPLGATSVTTAGIAYWQPLTLANAHEVPSSNNLHPNTDFGDGEKGDRFGRSVAIDGDTAVIGVPNDSVGGLITNGSIYVFKLVGASWQLQAKLIAADASNGDHFGEAVAISGGTIVAGAPTDRVGSNFEQGSAYIFVRSGDTWTQQAKLTANDGAGHDTFGAAVAISGDTVLVGAPWDDVSFENQGSVHVFVRTGNDWATQAKLTTQDGNFTQKFGYALAWDGSTAIVGAPGDSSNGSSSGSAYVMVRVANTWSQQAKLSSGSPPYSLMLGTSVAISGDRAIVGAPGDLGNFAGYGSAYVFSRSGVTWTREARLQPSDQGPQKQFGSAVAIDGTTVVAGAWYDNVNGNVEQGSAYVFEHNGSEFAERAKLFADDGTAYENFGNAVAVSGNNVLVAAYFDTLGNRDYQGSVFAYQQAGLNWPLVGRLTNGLGQTYASAGTSVALSDNTAVLGVPGGSLGDTAGSGSVEVFVRAGDWVRQATLAPPAGFAGAFFGSVVALSGDTLLVAGLDPNQGTTWRGTVFVYVRQNGGWTLQAQLQSADETENFGTALALYGDTALVGAPSAEAGQGVVYVYVREGSTWSQQAVLGASLQGQRQTFGYTLDINGDTVVIGAANTFDPVRGAVGAAFVYTRDGTLWTEQQRIDAPGNDGESEFGHAVAISGNTIAISASGNEAVPQSPGGSIYIFDRNGADWVQQARLNADLTTPQDQFGASLAMNGNILVAGAPQDDIDASVDRGSAHVFVRQGNDWARLSPFLAEGGQPGAQFGKSVAINGTEVIISSPGLDGPIPFGNRDEGAAFVFDPVQLFQDGFD